MTSLPPAEAVLFDWDNTLVDTWPVIHRALTATFTHFEMEPWTLEEVHQRVRGSARDTFPALFGMARTAEATEVFYCAFQDCHLAALAALPGAEALLAALCDAGLYLALVSNKRGDFLRREMAHLGWGKYFSAAVGANDAGKDKPAIDPVLLALAPARASASGPGEARALTPNARVWFVGDTDIDLLCAATAGCTGVLLRALPPAPGEFAAAPPAAYAESFGQLLGLVMASRRS
jgi:phosphoglycolate phosphatase|tara:strand:+ start:3354 stop:4055 length:702 start_codon:yes stop_codon:yes gene_type:complete